MKKIVSIISIIISFTKIMILTTAVFAACLITQAAAAAVVGGRACRECLRDLLRWAPGALRRVVREAGKADPRHREVAEVMFGLPLAAAAAAGLSVLAVSLGLFAGAGAAAEWALGKLAAAAASRKGKGGDTRGVVTPC